ncbi:hypothetical protein [Rubrobacter marinus]|uniref:hypothetical protein n=1 Tax=Rubrobacter marinus TaxID=2653852 RepID=UPI001A9EED56|nr:hypothetical protein [Rubrobacter marinus]
MARVLVVYGTGEGQTAKISNYAAEVAGEHGHDARVADVKELPEGFSPRGTMR